MFKNLLTFGLTSLLFVAGCSTDNSGEPSAGSGGESGAGSGGESGLGGAGGEGGASGMGNVGGASGMGGEGGGGAGGAGGMGGAGGASGTGGEGGSGSPGCDDAVVGDIEQRTRYAEAEVESAGDCMSEVQERTCRDEGWDAWSGSYEAESCTVVTEPGCDGMTEMRTRYAAEEVAYGETCASQSQSRSCTGETWGEWSGTFEHAACTVAAPADCEGAEHGENASRMRYETATVPYGETCDGETQTAACEDGELGAWSGTYTFEACAAEPGLPCGDVASGGQNMRTRYQASTVPYGQTCASQMQTQTCTNGTLGDWTGTYTHEACTVDPPADCAGGMHGDMHTRMRYQAATVAWGTSCVSEQQSETCDNGTWLPWTGTYAFEACTVSDPVDCDGGAHGTAQMRTRYATANVPNGETCQSEAQARTCTNGTWGGWSGTYTHENCVVLPPFAGSCTISNAGVPFGCLDMIGSAYTPATVMATCSGGANYAYSAGHCAEGASLLGTCTGLVAAANLEQVLYYYQSGVYPTATNAQLDCTNRSGTWNAH